MSATGISLSSAMGRLLFKNNVELCLFEIFTTEKLILIMMVVVVRMMVVVIIH